MPYISRKIVSVEHSSIMARSILMPVLLSIVAVIISFEQATAESFFLPSIRPNPAHEGTSMELSCGIDSTQIDSSTVRDVYWNFGRTSNAPTRIMNANPHERVYIKPMTDSGKAGIILVINHLQKSDETEYMCVVVWDSGSYVQNVPIKVISKPVQPFILPRRRPIETIVEGTGISLMCGIDRAQGIDPIDKNVYWYQVVGGRLQLITNENEQNRVHITVMDIPNGIYGQKLNINPTIKEDEGEYQCIVGWAQSQEVYPVYLIVTPQDRPAKPFLLPRDDMMKSVKEGDATEFVCGIDRSKGVDPIDKEVYWEAVVGNQPQRIVSEDPRDRIHITTEDVPNVLYAKTLRLFKIHKGDETEYRCNVVYGQSRIWYSVFLYVTAN